MQTAPTAPSLCDDPYELVHAPNAAQLSDDAHTTDDGWERVTGLLARYFGKFDAEREADALVQKHGLKTKQEYLDLWAHYRDEGIALSAAMDSFYRHGLLTDGYHEEVLGVEAALRSVEGERLTERKLRHNVLRVQGRADLIVRHSPLQVSVFDFKRAKRGEQFGSKGESKSAAIPRSARWSTADKCHMTTAWPLEHLVCSKFNQYAMQISLYAYLLELQGYDIRETAILLIRAKGEVDRIDVPYLKSEAELVLANRAAELLTPTPNA